MGRFDQLLELSRVRLLLFVREPEALFWVFVFPLVLAVVLGFAFRNSEVQPSIVRVLPGLQAEALVERLAGTEHLDVELAEDAAVAAGELRRGKIDALVAVGDPPVVRLDPQRPEAEAARLRVLLALGVGGPEEEAALGRIEPVDERGSRYLDFLFPGLLGLNLMGTGMWTIGFAVAELRQKKVLTRLLVTPLRRSTFLASFLVARLVFLAFEVGVLVLFGAFVLDVPFEPSLPSFALLCVLGGITFAGLGMLATSRAKTIQGASGLMNLVMMPMWLLSGVFFSYERFPDVVQPLLRLLPLTALVDALRASMLDGDGLLALAAPLAVLAGWAALSFGVALRIFRWQ
jgi:ABC-type polysaccharide/polyol phosphate export permease